MLTLVSQQARKAEAAAAAAAALETGDSLVEEYMKSLREQSLETPRSGRRDRRKNLLATATSGRDSPALVKERNVQAAPEPQTDSPASPTVPEGGLSDLLASGQELMARLTGEGVSPDKPSFLLLATLADR